MNAATTLPELTSLEQARGVVTSIFDQLQQALWRVAQLEKELYGPSSERQVGDTLSKEQILLSLFPAAQPAATQPVLLPAVPDKTEPRVRRQPAAKVLETVTERIEPQEKICPHCGRSKCEMGREKSERFEYVSAQIIRHEILRPKRACPCGQGGVGLAPLPPRGVEQGQAGASLIAHLILSKYDDHLPLYRQQQQLARLGVDFPRQTLCDWVEKGAAWLQPIVRQMKAGLLAGDYMQVDETPVKVMDPEVQGRCATGYLWVAGVPGEEVSVACPGLVRTDMGEHNVYWNVRKEDHLAQLPLRWAKEPGQVAKGILRGVARNQQIIVFPFSVRAAWWIHRVCPWVFAPLMGGC